MTTFLSLRPLRAWLSGRRRFVAAGILAGAVIMSTGAVLIGLGGFDDRPATMVVPPKPLPSSDPRAQAVVRDYEAYWATLLKASDPADPGSAGLASHATAEELRRARAALTARRQAGEVVRGRYEHQAGDVSIVDGKASLSDCLTPRTAVYDGGKGRLKSRDPQQPQPLEATLQLEDGTWKVALINLRQDPAARCAA